MSFKYPKPGPNFTPAYQVSGIPYVTASIANEVPGVHDGSGGAAPRPSPIQVDFDYVTKWIEIKNTHGSNGLRVAFTLTGSYDLGEKLPEDIVKGSDKTRNFFVLASGQKVKYDVRCKSLFFLANTETGTPTNNANKSQFELRAGLTSIAAADFPVLTGSLDGNSSFAGVG